MMLPGPRIIVIDDDLKHLRGLADGLSTYGIGCLQIHFTGDPAAVKSCPYVRVIFADLHLNESGPATEHEKHFATIGGLLEENIIPSGPYIIILWTRYPEQADALGRYLERVEKVAKPFGVHSLDKAKHLDNDGNVLDATALLTAIQALLEGQPQISALFNWEEQVHGAAANTVGAIIDLAAQEKDPKRRDAILDRLMCKLATEAVGETHVERDRFKAVNAALLPILADRIAVLGVREADVGMWKNAFSLEHARAEVSLDEAATLNSLLHFAIDGDVGESSEPGAVIHLTAELIGRKFEASFGITETDAAGKQFACKDYTQDDNRFRWTLVQVEAACDHAQRKIGPIPFALALEMPWESRRAEKPPAALWFSPTFNLNEKIKCLNVHSRFLTHLTQEDLSPVRPLYRIREQLLSDLIYKIHSHGMRPGFISFREEKSRRSGSKENIAPEPTGLLRRIWNALIKFWR